MSRDSSGSDKRRIEQLNETSLTEILDWPETKGERLRVKTRSRKMIRSKMKSKRRTRHAAFS